MEKEKVEAGLARLLALREEWEAWRAQLSGAYDRREDEKLDDELLKLFKAYRKALQEALHLKPGFTYEELILHVQRSHTIPLEVKELLVRVADHANRVEYVEQGSYEEISTLLDETIHALQLLLEHVPKAKRRRKRGKQSRLVRGVLGVTFLLWGPFALAWKAVSRRVHALLVQQDPRRLVKRFLREGYHAIKQGDLAEAVRVYEEIRKEYARLPEAVQRAIRAEIITYYNELLDAYERVTGEHVREDVHAEMKGDGGEEHEEGGESEGSEGMEGRMGGEESEVQKNASPHAAFADASHQEGESAIEGVGEDSQSVREGLGERARGFDRERDGGAEFARSDVLPRKGVQVIGRAREPSEWRGEDDAEAGGEEKKRGREREEERRSRSGEQRGKGEGEKREEDRVSLDDLLG